VSNIDNIRKHDETRFYSTSAILSSLRKGLGEMLACSLKKVELQLQCITLAGKQEVIAY
jgi:hypothetical protein